MGTYLSNSRVTEEPRAFKFGWFGFGALALPELIWMRSYHFCFFLGPPLISKMILLSPLNSMFVILAWSPGFTAGPYRATMFCTSVSFGETWPFLMTNPL